MSTKNQSEKRLIWQISFFLGIIFFIIQTINSLFFQHTENFVIRIPISENHGNQFILIQLITIGLIVLISRSIKSRVELLCIISWLCCLINSILLRYNEHDYYTISFLFAQILTIAISFIALKYASPTLKK